MFVGVLLKPNKGSNHVHFEVRNWSQTFDTVVWIGFQHNGWNSSQLVWKRLQRRSWNSQIRSSARKNDKLCVMIRGNRFFGEGAQVCIYGHTRAKPGVATSCIWYLRTWHIACLGNIYIYSFIYRWKQFETSYVQIHVCRWHKLCHKVQAEDWRWSIPQMPRAASPRAPASVALQEEKYHQPRSQAL